MVVMALLHPDGLAVAAKPPACPAGRFLVAPGGGQVVPGRGVPEVIEVGAGASVSLDGCMAAAAKVRAGRRFTVIKGRWPQCGPLSKVKLSGRIGQPDCVAMAGTLKAKGQKVRGFSAGRSTCGDGVLDRPAEDCEPTAADGAGLCRGTCAGPGLPGACHCTVTASYAPERYLFLSGAESGTRREITSDQQPAGQIVTSPVRTGRYAHQIANGPGQGSELPIAFEDVPGLGVDVYFRAYVRIDVSAPPPAEEFAPLLDYDCCGGQLMCSADVGVQPDGRIRFRLRDRINGVTLGATDVRAAGSFAQLELHFRGDAGGGADDACGMRVDGALVAESSALQLTTTPVDFMLLSNRTPTSDPPPVGVWTATFDDVAVTTGTWPGSGRIIARQGRPGSPAYDQWRKDGAATIDAIWSDTPFSQTTLAESPAEGDPVSQTMLVAPLNQGLDAVDPNVHALRGCEVLVSSTRSGAADRSYALRRRVGGVDVDTDVSGRISAAEVHVGDGRHGTYWSNAVHRLAAAEIGAVKSGGSGGASWSIADAWLVCEYE
jgi:hypothetical protein